MLGSAQTKVRHCDDCAHRTNCPRMRGVNVCFGVAHPTGMPGKSNEPDELRPTQVPITGWADLTEGSSK
jgi:hypothetical protein